MSELPPELPPEPVGPSSLSFEDFEMMMECPNCGAVVSSYGKNHDLLSWLCAGCGRMVISLGERSLSAPAEKVLPLFEEFGYEVCGSIDHVDLRNRYKDKPPISDRDLKNLRRLLDEE